MRHQILGLRDYTNAKGEVKKKDAFYDKEICADTLQEIFENATRFVEKFGPGEDHNLYFTVAKCAGKREFRSQGHIPFDIDDIDPLRAEDTLREALNAINIPREGTLAAFTGHGLQFFVALKEEFEDPNYFDQNREFYKAICKKIDLSLKRANLPGHADTSVFSLARLMRLPDSWNIKPDLPKVMAYTIEKTSVPVSFSLREAAGFPDLAKEEVLAKWPPPDTEAVLNGCENIKKMLSDPNNIPEPLWYATASVIGRLGGTTEAGRSLWHSYSKHYSKYEASEADSKLDQALQASGPRTCKNFSSLPGSACEKCQHFRKLKSPILLVGPSYIRTKEWGFHERATGAEGQITIGKVCYDDLVKFFEQTYNYIVNKVSGSIYVWDTTHYRKFEATEAKAFAERHFVGCNSLKANEFHSKLIRRNLVGPEWFPDSTHGKMNFVNGVLDTTSLEFVPTSKDFGFLNTIPYSYDPQAEAPRFERFLDEVTSNDQELTQQLLEFSGYALSNEECWEHKALVLVGHGANGKSVFLESLMAVAETGYSCISMRSIQNEQFAAGLEGKSFNAAEESASAVFRDTDIFKALVSGGKIHVKTVYEKPYEIRNRAKLIFSCNEIPASFDASHGFFRRFSIVPFHRRFTEQDRDPRLLEKLKAERAGILNLMLAAYRDMKARGHLFQAEASTMEMNEYREYTDDLGTWVKENIIVSGGPDDAGIKLVSKDLYSAYCSHCESGNIKPLTSPAFFARICHMIPKYKDRRHTIKIEGNAAKVLYGLTLENAGAF